MKITTDFAESAARERWMMLRISSGRLGLTGLMQKESMMFGLRQKFTIEVEGNDLFTQNGKHIGELISHDDRGCVIKIYPNKWALTKGASVRPYLSQDYYGTLYMKLLRSSDEIVCPGVLGDTIYRSRRK